MAKNSAIEWTHHTFNAWWGCVKVSPACDHCYAEAWARRVGQPVWGKDAPRRFFTEKHWREPLGWNQEAELSGTRRRVFCSSMADVFERRADLNASRERLWRLIESTPSLDWLLLTKRPQNVAAMVPWGMRWPANVWLGTTAEDQAWYDNRARYLDESPAAVVFLSFEPLLGPIRLNGHRLDWAIVGGESGSGARSMDLRWARGLRDSCREREVPFFFKQVGGRRDKRSELSSIPRDLRIREFPT